ncbi:hypothetical protein GCM10009601_60390 [Streptomyces thermospinosisporus]|uniref:Uncharacterized protein n=1 Tax=Streptomyces thermospinosisporus TaxID=161482 RepID=A0ABP4JY15_9ACTN
MTALRPRRRVAALALAGATLLPAPVASAAPVSADQGAASVHTEAERPSRDALRLLAQPPFAPTDLSLLNTQSYPQGPPMQPAPPREITAEELVKQLKTTLKPRGHRAVEEGLAVFRSSRIATVVPDLNLRAALASLAGSPAQASIQAIRHGVFHRVYFGTPPNPAATAQVVVGPNGPEIIFNQRFRYEDFRLLGVVLSHETLHQDSQVNDNEELINSALQLAYYGQLLLKEPQVATSRTELSRRHNTGLMALLNTRDARGSQRLTHATGNVLPGAANSLPSFGAAFLGITPDGGTGTDPTSTPGNANLDFFLRAITCTRQTGAAFNTATVEVLDCRQTWATPSERIRLARLLKLRIPQPPSRLPHREDKPWKAPASPLSGEPGKPITWGMGTDARPSHSDTTESRSGSALLRLVNAVTRSQ